jgi:hypothetical protein
VCIATCTYFELKKGGKKSRKSRVIEGCFVDSLHDPFTWQSCCPAMALTGELRGLLGEMIILKVAKLEQFQRKVRMVGRR